jgi:molybdopterin/thiamine biosynthesis adenylyltransferase
MNIKIIGLGGIGSILADKLCRYINYSNNITCNITFIDGDEYEYKNFNRQIFNKFGNKANVKSEELSNQFPRINFDSIETYIDQNNISKIIYSNDIVFICVDNHKSRMIINNYCKTLTNIIVISGGNELLDGNIQIYVRKEDKDLTPDLCKFHPEIANPTDKLPTEMSCEELSRSEPQLFFTNLCVATFMCLSFYNVVINDEYKKSEVYFDIKSMNALSKMRKLG